MSKRKKEGFQVEEGASMRNLGDGYFLLLMLWDSPLTKIKIFLPRS